MQHQGQFLYNIGVLDDNYNYYEHQLMMKVESITPFAYKSLNKLFNNYSITKETEIDILDNISRQTPLYMYLSIINQQVFANIRFVSIDMIPRRIATYHKTYLGKKASNVTKYSIERLWAKLVELEKCPWITKEIDKSFELLSAIARKRQIILRMGLYYCIVKRFLVTAAIKARDNKRRIIQT